MTYIAKSGDTLSKIASQYNIPWRDLYNANKSVIGSNPNLIYSGQEYTIPGTSTPAPTPVSTVSDGTIAGRGAGEAMSLTPFSDILGFGSYFDPNLARSSAEQIASAFYVPQVERGRRSLESGFAGRGLTRSGQRGTSISDLYQNIGQQQQASSETDITQMKREAQEEHAKLQELYEQSEGKEKPSGVYEGYGYEPPKVSAGRYGTTYQNWLNKILNT